MIKMLIPVVNTHMCQCNGVSEMNRSDPYAIFD